MYNVNLIVALHSALCGSILALIEAIPTHDKRICRLLRFISNVVQNVNLIFALQSTILAIIALTFWSMDVKIIAFVQCCLTLAMLYKMLILFLQLLWQ